MTETAWTDNQKVIVDAIAKRAKALSAEEFLRAFARAFIVNTDLSVRATAEEIQQQLVLEMLDQDGGECLPDLAVAFKVDLR